MLEPGFLLYTYYFLSLPRLRDLVIMFNRYKLYCAARCAVCFCECQSAYLRKHPLPAISEGHPECVDGHFPQGIDSKRRETILLDRIDQLQAEVERAEQADKAAQEQAFR